MKVRDLIEKLSKMDPNKRKKNGMRHIFGHYWNCECGCDTMIVTCQKYDGEDWVTRKEMESDPEVARKVAECQSYPCLWVSDFTNITCDGCGRRISEEEWKEVRSKIPKVPIREWTFKEEPGICIINSEAEEQYYHVELGASPSL